MTAARYDFVIEQGATFDPVLRYSTSRFAVKPITGITKSGQAVVTCTHGLTTDWSVYVVGALGMSMLNHKSSDLRIPSKAYEAYYVNATSLMLDVDTTRFGAWTSGGEILYRIPKDLTGYTARMHIRATVDSTTILQTLTSEDGDILLGDAAGTIQPIITAADAAALTFSGAAVYDLEVVTGTTVRRVFYGNFTLSKEVTRE